MKFNWGSGIAVFYALFVLALLFALIQSKRIATNRSMVTENYYEKDLNYKQKYDKIENSSRLAEKLKIIENTENGTVDIIFPKGMKDITGTVLFYRPSSKGMDVKIPIENLQEGILPIPMKSFATGNWAVQVDWESSGKAYFDKANLYLP